jgi:hypothetical protein
VCEITVFSIGKFDVDLNIPPLWQLAETDLEASWIKWRASGEEVQRTKLSFLLNSTRRVSARKATLSICPRTHCVKLGVSYF